MKYFIIKYNFTMNAVVDNQCGVVNKMAATSFCFQSVSEVDLDNILNDLPTKLFILNR